MHTLLSNTKKGFLDYKQSHPTRPSKPNYVFMRATLEYVDVIKKCNPHFRPECMFIPKRTLTYPRQPAKNHGHDNIQDDYILRVHEPLGNKYIILDLMGQGTFGQVVKCKATKTGEYVAIKVIKRQHAFFMQGLKEIEILKKLKQKQDEHHRFLQLIHSFEFRGHLCVVFELLSISLQALFRQQSVRPRLSIHDIQQIAIPLLETLARLKEMRIIHTDLKPDNILLKDPDRLHDVKLIDYGSALFETDSPHYHIQTAFYRSPEVILQDAFGCAIDMWSFGCFVAELWIGKPLFPSGHEATLIHMMVATLKQLPPAHMLHRAKRSSEFFDQSQLRHQSQQVHPASLKERIMGTDPTVDQRHLFDFLSHILVFDPAVRYTPQQALNHPFLSKPKVLKSILKTSKPKDNRVSFSSFI